MNLKDFIKYYSLQCFCCPFCLLNIKKFAPDKGYLSFCGCDDEADKFTAIRFNYPYYTDLSIDIVNENIILRYDINYNKLYYLINDDIVGVLNISKDVFIKKKYNDLIRYFNII